MGAELEPYPRYKDSGVASLGAVPAHWEVRRLKQICRIGYGDSLADDTRQDGNIPVFGSNGQVGVHDSANTNAPCIVIGRKGSFGKINYCHEPVFAIDTTFFVDSRFSTANMRWLYFLLGWLRLDEATRDSAVPGLDREDAYQRLGVLPPRAEQAAIVRFLDHADRRIRRYIRAKEKLITLLEEQKQAIIRQAVTGKIDVRTGEPYSAYKSFGAEWMGEVPERWNVIRLKLIATKIVDCLHATPNYSEDGEFPAVRTADISPGEVHVSSARRVDTVEYVRWTARLEPKRGDILYSREGERFGIAACVPDGVRLCISQRMMVFRIRAEHNSTFVMWVLNSNPVLAQARQYIMGATAPHVNVSTIRNYCLALPGRDEQDRLVDTIENRTKGQGAAIAAARQSIACLGEYRTRLVADVVSGKVDVRAAAARLEETDPLAPPGENDREPGAGAESSPHEPLGTIDEARA